MRTIRKGLVLGVFILLALGTRLRAQTQAGAVPLGLIAKAVSAHVGNGAATEGATIFSGDYLSTDDSGSLQVRAGALAVELQPNSAAHIYRAPYGVVVELNRGSVLYTTPGGAENVVVVASDVRVTPVLTLADFGRVSIEDECNVDVQSEKGQTNVQSGSESKLIEQGKSYRVRAENSLNYREYVSPDDNDYHRYHEHKPCAAAYQTWKTARPIAGGSSKFLYLAGATAVIVTTIPIIKASESPSRP